MWFVCFGKTARVTFCQFGTIYGADDERCNAKRSVVLVVIMCESILFPCWAKDILVNAASPYFVVLLCNVHITGVSQVYRSDERHLGDVDLRRLAKHARRNS